MNPEISSQVVPFLLAVWGKQMAWVHDFYSGLLARETRGPLDPFSPAVLVLAKIPEKVRRRFRSLFS